MPSFKVAILEQNGIEFDGPVEYDLYSALIQLGFVPGSGGGGAFNEDTIAVDYNYNVTVNYEQNLTRTY